jgi:smad nuclear-interacting protein 1
MVRSPKSSSHHNSSSNHKSKRRRDSSSSDSDGDRQRYQKWHRDDDKSYSNKSDVRVKQEPMTDDDSRRQRPNKSYESRRNPRERDDKTYQWGKQTEKEKPKEAPIEKEKPNFSLSGALLKDTNTYNGVVIKYSEPIEARRPKRRWRLYVFKGEQVNENFNSSIKLF